MSFIQGAKEFFGLAPVDGEPRDDAYYDEPRYEDDGAAAYQPRYEREERYSSAARTYEAPARTYEPAVVSVIPTRYNDAAQVGEPFRDGDIVIFELTDCTRDDAKRLIDFAAGLCYAARGTMHNLAKGADTGRRVFAIVPADADASVSELKRSARLY